MAFRCGFYNAVNHDRTYNATEFGDLFTGLINDGVYATVGHAMTVAPVSGMTVKVRSGRAWFNKTWNVNDSDYPLSIPVSDLLLPRVDAVILEVDTRLAVRNNSLKVVKGKPDNNPSYPTLTRANGLYQYPLAYVRVNANARNITSADIEVVVGRNPTPFVTGIVGTADISDFWEQWDSEFHAWFDELRTNMSGDVAQNLQNQIEQLKVSMITTDNRATTSQAQSGSSDSVWMTPSKTLSFYNYRLAPLSDVQKEQATENTHIVTPLRLQNYMDYHKWDPSSSTYAQHTWVSSYALSTEFRSRAATNEEVAAGGIDWKYVSPFTLKTALANFTPSGGGGSSTPSSTTGTGTIVAHSGVTITQYNVRYCHFGPLVTMYYNVQFAVTRGGTFVGFTIQGLPTPTNTFVSEGVLRRADSRELSQMFRLLGVSDKDGYISATVEIHGSGDAFTTSYNYFISGTVTYY